ncbi:hypothetical protein QTO34_005202, partial [Cnephaeus nilssonii]
MKWQVAGEEPKPGPGAAPQPLNPALCACCCRCHGSTAAEVGEAPPAAAALATWCPVLTCQISDLRCFLPVDPRFGAILKHQMQMEIDALRREKSSMRPENQSSVSQFLLLGLPITPGQQGVFFTLFLSMYLTTSAGQPAHHPTHQAGLSPAHAHVRGHLSASALHHHHEGGAVCLLVVGSWIVACVHLSIHTLLLVQLSFCADNTITHFFCDLAALLKLSCSDTFLNVLVIFTETGVIFVLCLGIILGSYIPFSTCGSHLSVVFLYYGALAGVYFSSSSWGSKDIIASVMYTVVTPMLNPFIYSLRNRDIKEALEMCVIRVKFFKQQSLNPLVAARST